MKFLVNKGVRTGLFFGATSGVITTLGLITGLNAGTHSITAVLGGIFVIAVADSMSDALGIHLAEEWMRREHVVSIPPPGNDRRQHLLHQ